MYPRIKFISTELVLIPFSLVPCLYILKLLLLRSVIFSLKIPDVTERLRGDSLGRASNVVFTIWAVFGGFILHFLLSNYLTVLLRPSYEEPVDTVSDLIKRDITPFLSPGSEIFQQFFATSSNPNYQEISRRLVIAKDWDDYEDMVRKVTSTGLYADIAPVPDGWYITEEEYKYWYRSSETIGGFNQYTGHLANKKWPLKKVF